MLFRSVHRTRRLTGLQEGRSRHGSVDELVQELLLLQIGQGESVREDMRPGDRHRRRLFAEFVTVPTDNVIGIPDSVTYEQTAFAIEAIETPYKAAKKVPDRT